MANHVCMHRECTSVVGACAYDVLYVRNDDRHLLSGTVLTYLYFYPMKWMLLLFPFYRKLWLEIKCIITLLINEILLRIVKRFYPS